MSSLQKINANRANARASTGPQSKHGKARAARNARRHGLSVPVWVNTRAASDAENLAREIAGAGATGEIMVAARRVAEAQIDLIRVRGVVRELISPGLTNALYDPIRGSSRLPSRKLLELWTGRARPEKLAYALADLWRTLKTIDRYERRALSRRRSAIRDFDAAKAAMVHESSTHSDIKGDRDKGDED